MNAIKKRIDNREITTARELKRDFLLMFSNALMFYGKDSEVFTPKPRRGGRCSPFCVQAFLAWKTYNVCS